MERRIWAWLGAVDRGLLVMNLPGQLSVYSFRLRFGHLIPQPIWTEDRDTLSCRCD